MTDTMRIVDTTTPVLSFPAILRNPGINSRFAHIDRELASGMKQPLSASAVAKKRLREQNEGKRWVRRNDNAKFVGNPHVVTPSKKDYALQAPQTRPTFPEPLPPYLPRTAKVPTLATPVTDPNSANAGRFSLSLKGMRRDLRRAGGKAQILVQDVEDVIVGWLLAGGTVLAPDAAGKLDADTPGVPIGNTGSIYEVSRTPLQLVWRISNDAFTRYVVHCCARYHEVVSFSKGPEDQRLTYLLRPNVTRPNHYATASLETPPVTDIDYSSQQSDLDIDSDFISEHELELSGIDSEPEGDSHLAESRGGLEAIREASAPGFPNLRNRQDSTSDTWPTTEDDADADNSGSEIELESAVTSMSLNSISSPLRESEEASDPDRTLTDVPIIPPETTHSRPSARTINQVSSNIIRSTSSPSLSPVRIRHPRKRVGRGRLALGVDTNGRPSLYDYLFS